MEEQLKTFQRIRGKEFGQKRKNFRCRKHGAFDAVFRLSEGAHIRKNTSLSIYCLAKSLKRRNVIRTDFDITKYSHFFF